MPKKTSYRISNSESIMLRNYIYVDKTQFIYKLLRELIRQTKNGLQYL
ncbi:MAG: hypothetical protein LBF01_04020 [Bacteroidales bacterium]|nr:hypothetical protein [Bacteroidales bacterium]